MPQSPEQAIKSLSRLPPNTTCPNCGTFSKYGFSTVCIKYHTFVCNACKTSHQAVSHRCKSLTMSSWDAVEVLLLKTRGNEYARRVWLGNAPEIGVGGRPKEGDDINVFKRFVVECYEKKRYYKEPVEGGEKNQQQQQASGGGNARPTSRVQSAGRTITSHKPNVALQPNGFGLHAAPRATAETDTRPPRQSSVAATPAPQVDLLDFGAFDSAPLSTNVPSAHVLSTATTGTADPFDPFNSKPTATTATTSAGNSSMGEAPTNPTGGGFDDSSFDPFGAAQTTSMNNATAPSTSKPIMNNNNNNNFGMMNGGMHNNMMQSGMNGMNNNAMMNNAMMNGAGMMQSDMMSNPMMIQNQMMPNMMNGMMSNQMMMPNRMNGMVNNNNSMTNTNMGMMNGNIMSNNMAMHGTTMGNSNNMMNGAMGTANNAPQTHAMNMNIMQPMNNSISNNFGSKPANNADSGKKDPFAGLGF